MKLNKQELHLLNDSLWQAIFAEEEKIGRGERIAPMRLRALNLLHARVREEELAATTLPPVSEKIPTGYKVSPRLLAMV